MDSKAFRAEIARLQRIIVSACQKAKEQAVLIDKLTAAQLQVEVLLKKLRHASPRRRR